MDSQKRTQTQFLLKEQKHIFETVFESQKSLCYIVFKSVLSDFDLCSSLKSSYKVAKKELKVFLLFSCFDAQKELFLSFKNSFLEAVDGLEKA